MPCPLAGKAVISPRLEGDQLRARSRLYAAGQDGRHVQCPLCGQEVDDLVGGGLCSRCAAERKPFLDAPDVVDVVRCAHCDRVREGAAWIPGKGQTEATASAALHRALWIDPGITNPEVGTTLTWEDETNARAEISLAGQFRGHSIERHAESRVRIKRGACDDCSREQGGYYEAILQIRGHDRDILATELEPIDRRVWSTLGRFRQEHRPGAFITKSEAVRGGIDYYVGSLDVARALSQFTINRYGAEHQETRKLIGRQEGRDVYRSTISVRLPAYAPGDFIELDKRVYKVLKHEGRTLILWDMTMNQRVQRSPRRARGLRVIGRSADERSATVVSCIKDTLQFLDPDSYRTVEVATQKLYADDSKVRVFHHEGQWYVVPPEVAGQD